MWPFSFSLETANWLSDIANGVLIASLIAVLIATFAIVKTSSVKEAYWDKAREDAKAELAKANVTAATANDIAAQANEKAEAERLARVKIEERIAPRRLSGERIKKIREFLSKTPGYSVVLCARMYDSEAADFLSDFSAAIAGAGWTVQSCNSLAAMQQRGIFVAHVDFADVSGQAELQNALKAIDIQPGFLSLNAEAGPKPGGFRPGVLYLLIGEKP